MKKWYSLVAATLGMVFGAGATPQAPDVILIDGVKMMLRDFPLDKYMQDNKLYLTEIEGYKLDDKRINTAGLVKMLGGNMSTENFLPIGSAEHCSPSMGKRSIKITTSELFGSMKGESQ